MPDDFAILQNERCDGRKKRRATSGISGIHNDARSATALASATRAVVRLWCRVSDSAATTPLARTQERLPTVNATAFGNTLAPVRCFHFQKIPTTTGE